jgi:starch-binding outer membrane protein, SusD/RagB family
MKKLNIIFISLFVCLAACNVLDQKPQTEIDTQDFFADAPAAEAAVINVYNDLLGNFNANYLVAADWPADICFPSRYFVPFFTDFTQLASRSFNAFNGAVGSIWGDSYRTIRNTNFVLENVPRVPDNSFRAGRKAEILAEAHCIRAFTYFYLVRFFGDVPLVLATPTDVSISANQILRTPSAQVYEQILADLLIAERDLPNNFSTTVETKGRVTKWFAKALLARVHLTLKNYQLAADKAGEVMGSGQFALVDDYGLLFRNPGNSTESIFELQYTARQSNALAAFIYQAIGAGFHDKVDAVGDPIVSNTQPVTAFVNSFALTDKRRLPTFIAEFGTNYGIRKYESFRTGDDNIIIARLAEMILTRAEALNELGQTPEALELCNRIRTRAGLGTLSLTNPNEVREAIWEERKKELCYEGHRWFDLLRTGKIAEKTIITNPERWLMPIPQNERNVNPKLIQNPGY